MEKKPHGNKGKPKSEEQKEKLRQANLGKKRSQEAIDKQQETRRKNKLAGKVYPNIYGHTSWNKGLTKETDERVKKYGESLSKHKKENPRIRPKEECEAISFRMKGEKNFFYGKTHTPETRKKISDSRKGVPRPPVTEETRKKLSKAMLGKPKSPEQIAALKKNHRHLSPPNKGVPMSEEQKRKCSDAAIKRIQQGRNSRVSETIPEKNTKVLFDKYNIKWYKQFALRTLETKRSKLYDFYLPDHKLLLEIDGIYWHGKGILHENLKGTRKPNRFNDILKNNLALDSGYRLLRIWEDELDKLENLIKNNFIGLEYMEINDSNKDNYFENLVYLQ